MADLSADLFGPTPTNRGHELAAELFGAPPHHGASQGFLQNVIGSVYDPLANMASSIIAKPISDIAGLAATAKEAISPSPAGSATPEDFKRYVQEGLTYQPQTTAGRFTTDYNPLALAAKGVNAVAQGAGNLIRGDASANDLRGMGGNAVAEGINQVPGLVLSSPTARGAIADMAGSGLKATGEAIASPMLSAAQRLMISSLKPTIKMHQTGAAERAAQTLLDQGVNVSGKGLDTLQGRVDVINKAIAESVANSPATISKAAAAQPLSDVMNRVTNQVDPVADMNTVESARTAFEDHPLLQGGDEIPVSLAQQLKQGTYQQLRKKYGEMGSADVESQKALARGLKEEIAKAVPGIGELNAADSALINAMNVTERRVLMDANKNPGGLAWLAHNPKLMMAFLADRSPLVKSMVANALHTGANVLTGKRRSTLPTAITPERLPALNTPEATGPLPNLPNAPPVYMGSENMSPAGPANSLTLADLSRMLEGQDQMPMVPGQSYSVSKSAPQGGGPTANRALSGELLSLSDLVNPKAPASPVESMNFPLRQEVLQQPEIAQAIDSFRTESARLQRVLESPQVGAAGKRKATAELQALQENFAAGMKKLGIENAQDAHGLNRQLYQSGTTQLPIQRTFSK